MKPPEQYDPRPHSTQDIKSSPISPNYQGTHNQSPALPVGTPTITETHKRTAEAVKKPFQWHFRQFRCDITRKI